MSFDRRIAEVLIDEGRLSLDQVERAQLMAGDRGIRLPEALIQLQMIEDDGLAKATADYLGLEFRGEIDVDSINVELSADLSVSFAKGRLILPLDDNGGIVKVAVTDPLDLAALD